MSFEDRRKREVETALLALFDAHSRVARINIKGEDSEIRGVEIERMKQARRKIAETAVDEVIGTIERLEDFHEHEIDALSAECEANATMSDCSSLDPDAGHTLPVQHTGDGDGELDEGETDWKVDLEGEAEDGDELDELEEDVIEGADQLLEEMEAEQEAEEDGREGAEKEYDLDVDRGDRTVQIAATLLAADDPISSKEAAEWIEENVGLIDGSDPVNIASSTLSNAYSRDYFPIKRDTDTTCDGRWRYVYWIPPEDTEAVREAYSGDMDRLGISDVPPSDETESSESAGESDTEETVVKPTIEHQSREHEVLALLTQLSDREEEPKGPIALAFNGRRDVSEYRHVLDRLEDDGLVISEGDKSTRYRPSPSGRDELNVLGGFQVNGTTSYTGP